MFKSWQCQVPRSELACISRALPTRSCVAFFWMTKASLGRCLTAAFHAAPRIVLTSGDRGLKLGRWNTHHKVE